MREPGAVHKEDWTTGTASALAGGITMVLAMPNTNPSIVDKTALQLVSKLASTKALCDYGINVGASQDNHTTIASLARNATALKMYLNETYSTLTLNDMTTWIKVD